MSHNPIYSRKGIYKEDTETVVDGLRANECTTSDDDAADVTAGVRIRTLEKRRRKK